MTTSPDHLVAQARDRFALRDYHGAIHFLNEVVAMGHRFADVHHLLGLCHSMLGQPEEALLEFERALDLNAGYLEAHVHRGIVLNELGRVDDARRSFEAAERADPPTVAGFPAHVAGCLANRHAALGDAYAEAGAVEEAVAQYRRAIELGPGFFDLRYRMARLLLESAHTLEARDELEHVVEERPDFLDAHAALGLARFLSGDAAGAADVWRACLARRPENVRVEAYLAMVGRAEE
ncbi:MAG TPA: tetratricopeptide repeat protein [Gemmatimonadales bacterium]|nr:tetratricopeptide repeat protein [Gemmatimonadales bacterium]